MAGFLRSSTQLNLSIMLLRTIQFTAFLVAAYFFGSYIHQLWVAPVIKDLSGPAFVEVFKANSYYTNVRVPVITATLELLLVALLILRSKDRTSLSFVLKTIAFVALLVWTVINNQVYQNYSNSILSWNTAALPENWMRVRQQVFSYYLVSGICMVGVCILLFISFFFSEDFVSDTQQQKSNTAGGEVFEEEINYSTPVPAEASVSV
jgi:hypothetical protein